MYIVRFSAIGAQGPLVKLTKQEIILKRNVDATNFVILFMYFFSR